MEFEYWWLLAFPLFFGLGWLAARIDIKHVLSETRTLPDSYFKGLNFLLNEQPDKAIEAFTEVVKVDTETVELHFALGSLFRRRGEVERAIRLHQNLLDRGDLPKEQKLVALFEIGQDYLKAGLLDRAEQVFVDLQETSYSMAATKFLMQIYMQEKDWHKAISTAQHLSRASNQSYVSETAHFYCELALAESAHQNTAAARDYLEQALAIHKNCVRANVLLGDLEASEGDFNMAIQMWRRIELQSPAHLPLVCERLLDAYRSLDKLEEGVNLLRNYLANYPSADMLNVVLQTTLEHDGPEEAYRFVRNELKRNPSLQALESLVEIQLIEAPVERRQEMQAVKNLLSQHTRRLALYKCDNCGFKARQFYWFCPACTGWETFPPQRKEEYDPV